jgi:hypothetical protein
MDRLIDQAIHKARTENHKLDAVEAKAFLKRHIFVDMKSSMRQLIFHVENSGFMAGILQEKALENKKAVRISRRLD